MNSQPLLIRAAAIADGSGVYAAPGAVLVEGARIIASGSPQEVGEVAGARVIDEPRAVITPGLVNVHAHLDLSNVGPQPYEGRFVDWIKMVQRNRAADDAGIRAAVEKGVALSRAGGTAIIGAVAGVRSLAAVEALRNSGLVGVSFLEFFGIGERQEAAIDQMTQILEDVEPYGAIRLGLQPHAPYSCGPDAYQWAASAGYLLMTHLAETLEEVRFVRNGDGPFADMLKSFGIWDESIAGAGLHPVEYVKGLIGDQHCIFAHLNYIEAEHLPLLRYRSTVAYCPRASAYFGHPHGGFPPHQYGAIMEFGGINVALGTDSLICLDTPDRISVLDEMRLLYLRDATDPRMLLRMATVNGAMALAHDSELVTLEPGRTIGLLAIDFDEQGGTDPLSAALRNNRPPRWIHGPFPAQ